MNKMAKMAAQDVETYADELVDLVKEREQLKKELASKGESIVSNREVQNLNDVIEEVRTALEMAYQTYEIYTEE